MDTRTHKKIESGKINMASMNFPAFLWEDNGRKFDIDNMFEGFFRGFYIKRVGGPCLSHGSCSTKSLATDYKTYLHWSINWYGWRSSWIEAQQLRAQPYGSSRRCSPRLHCCSCYRPTLIFPDFSLFFLTL
jgi:hypothetical protein